MGEVLISMPSLAKKRCSALPTPAWPFLLSLPPVLSRPRVVAPGRLMGTNTIKHAVRASYVSILAQTPSIQIPAFLASAFT